MTPAEEQIRDALAAGPTPGPWWVDPYHYSDVQAAGTQLCVTWQSDNAGEEWTIAGPITVNPAVAEANAKLIAACNPAALAELLAELEGERNRSQMYADLVRGVAAVLHGEGWSDTSKLAEEVAALRKDAERYRWLREGYATLLLRYFPAPHKYLQASDVLDAAIDAAKGGGNG